MEKVTYEKTIRVEIDITRPDGTVETVDVSARYHRMNDVAFDQIKKATKAAGRGEVISYRNIKETMEYKLTEGDLQDVSHDQIIAMSRMGE